MEDLLAGMWNVDTFTISIVIALGLAAAFIIQLATESTALAVSYLPAMLILALFSISATRILDITITAQQDTNTILSACVGTIAGLFLMIVLTRVYYYVSDVKRAVTNDNPTDYKA
ncbi:MAG: hypothetical protein NW216_01440 [Hyphomicrobium sp.]|nr:hypothetical protein [Hyphomicrobium sp.]